MKISKKILAVLLTAAMLLSFAPCAFAEGGDEGRIDYTISNPYAGVDFAAYHQYKTDLHSHTLFSTAATPCPRWSSATMSWASISWR